MTFFRRLMCSTARPPVPSVVTKRLPIPPLRPQLRDTGHYDNLDEDVRCWCLNKPQIFKNPKYELPDEKEIMIPTGMNTSFLNFCRPIFMQMFNDICLENKCYENLVFKVPEHDDPRNASIALGEETTRVALNDDTVDLAFGNLHHLRQTMLHICQFPTPSDEQQLPLSAHMFFDLSSDILNENDPIFREKLNERKISYADRVRTMAYFFFKNPIIYCRVDDLFFIKKLYHLMKMMDDDSWAEIFRRGANSGSESGRYHLDVEALMNYNELLTGGLEIVYEKWESKCGRPESIAQFLDEAFWSYQADPDYSHASQGMILDAITNQLPTVVPLHFYLLVKRYDGDGMILRNERSLISYMEEMPQVVGVTEIFKSLGASLCDDSPKR